MKTPIIVLLVALATYTLAAFLNGKVESLTIQPLQAAIFAAIGGYAALLVAGMAKS